MSSDFYPPNLSRNLVSTGAFGYRENVARCLSIVLTEDATREKKRAPRRIVNFLVFPNFSLDAGTAVQKVPSDPSHIRLMVASLENRPLAGRLVLDLLTA
ncbi:hypothetical protein LJR030_003158 [Rhizobium sp. LjRoot30]|uniref:hypothetical protein n=1 Tax=Rhizobium sp. LjRoot30 TaxID=3342320 RepID=UPI003ED0B406